MAAETAARVIEAHQHLVDLDQRAAAGFTAEEIETLKDLLTRLSGNLEKGNGTPPGD